MQTPGSSERFGPAECEREFIRRGLSAEDAARIANNNLMNAWRAAEPEVRGKVERKYIELVRKLAQSEVAAAVGRRLLPQVESGRCSGPSAASLVNAIADGDDGRIRAAIRTLRRPQRRNWTVTSRRPAPAARPQRCGRRRRERRARVGARRARRAGPDDSGEPPPHSRWHGGRRRRAAR
jgi:hypothetical protein